jgi:hypothetical protein
MEIDRTAFIACARCGDVARVQATRDRFTIEHSSKKIFEYERPFYVMICLHCEKYQSNPDLAMGPTVRAAEASASRGYIFARAVFEDDPQFVDEEDGMVRVMSRQEVVGLFSCHDIINYVELSEYAVNRGVQAYMRLGFLF